MSDTVKVKPDELEDALNKMIDDYVDNVNKSVHDKVKEVSKEVLQNLKENVEAAGIKGDKYKNSFRAKATKETAWDIKIVIYSPTHYSLTHLLEHGHTIWVHGSDRNAKGKVYGSTKARPHWKPAESFAIIRLTEKIKSTVEDK